MSYLRFEKALMTNLEEALPRELLRTNRSGAYSCSTIVDCNTRKYHGLLVVPVPEIDDENHVLLSSLDVTVIQHGAEFNLGLHKYQGNNYSPKGHKYIREFDCDKVPTTVYRVGGVILKKEVVFQHYEDRILIRYTLEDAHSATTLRFRPFLAFRSVRQFTHENSVASRDPNGFTSRLYYHVRNFMLKRKERIVEMQAYRTSGSLLNYGAKTGFFSHRMEKHGWKVTSVEKYYEERQFSMEMFHHRMIDVHEIENLHPGTFDVITMWHVFEHSYHPHQLLDKFRELLRPGGVLVMACPNICSTDAIHYGSYWAAYDVPRHRWHFNPSSLTMLAQKHGFTLMHHERMPFDSFYISVLSERNMRHRMAFLRGMMIGLYSWIISLWNRGKSSSIVYVFRKR